MITRPALQSTNPFTRGRPKLSSRGRFILLIMLFNLLLLIIILLSIRNEEILTKTLYVQTVNVKIQTRLAIARRLATHVVYITATFTPTPATPTPSPSPTPTWTNTPVPPTNTPIPLTHTPTPSPTPTDTPTPVPTMTASPTSTSTRLPTSTPTPTPTSTPSATPTPTPTDTPPPPPPPPPATPTNTPVPNSPPVANDDTTTTAEDTPVTVGVLVNDTDVDGNLDPTTLSVTGGPTNGGAIVNPDQTITYTPNGNYSGVDSFTYQVCDTAGACDTATVTVTVTPANDQPQAVDDTATTGEDTPVTITVLANDTDPDIGDILSVTLVGTPTNGSTGTNGTTATYTPTLGFVGTDWFTYTVSDGSLTDTATVTVTVNPVNNPPVAADDTAITPEDTPVTIDVLTNDTDPDIGDILSVASVGMPANGTASTNGTTATYTPTLNFNGTDAFTYTVSDGSLTDTATVTVTVNPVNDPPVATGDAYSTNQDTPLTVAAPGVLGNDSDADSDPLTAITVTNPAGGVLAFNADGSFTYTPNAGFVGMDSFTYQANDGTVNSNIATVTINVIDTPPASPTNLRAAAGDNKIILGWDPNAEVDLAGYRVYRSDGGPFANTFTTTLTSHLDLTVTNGMIYSYTVTAFDMANNESTPSNVAVAQPYDITPYTYTTNVTCGGATVQNCSDAAGPPDDVEANITGTGVITFDFGLGTGIIDGPGYDMVFYENQNGPGIRLDYTQIELSADGVNWYTVFEWNGESPGDVMGTNIDAYAIDANGELENETIPSADLYPGGLPLNTGIAIDIGSVQPPLPPPGYSYRFVRFTFPSGGTDAAEIDAVRRLN